LRYHRWQESNSTITKSTRDFIISPECIKAGGEHHLRSESLLQFQEQREDSAITPAGNRPRNIDWTQRDKDGKKRGKSANKGACKELGTEKKVPTWGTQSKVDVKNPEAEIPNEDLSSRTNPRVEFEKNFRRAAFGLQENSKIDHAEDRCNHKVQRICEIHC
jgi:hypothetical protein